ncbi:MAG: EscU/YscU/HrcU family type III secretion system export apparatus switch protein, partial [Pseudomonas sp.]
MAESESGADKSEEPTSKRLEEARKKGQVARSRELNTLAVMLAGSGGLLLYGGQMGAAMADLMRANFSLPREVLMDDGSMARYLLASGMDALMSLQPLLTLLLIASIVGPIALGGWLFSGEALMPQFSRMNPLAGLKRMFSTKALVELLKALAKFTVILLVALAVLKSDQKDLLAIANEPVEEAILHSLVIVGKSLLWLACGLILITAVDVPFQLWDSKQKLMMTKQEVRDEYRDSEGKPEVKSKIRQMQRQ